MKKFAAIAIVLAAANLATAEVTGSVNGDGKIVISASPAVTAAGLNLQSAGGYLDPIPPGDLTASAAPFAFLLANNANQITWGNLGAGVVIDGDLVTSAGFTGTADNFDVTAAWGDGPNQVAFSVAGPAVVAPPVTDPTTPEPASGILAALGALGVLGFRRRR